ncbi:hypothetical protein ACLOJK_008167 [Asimina triloba]
MAVDGVADPADAMENLAMVHQAAQRRVRPLQIKIPNLVDPCNQHGAVGQKFSKAAQSNIKKQQSRPSNGYAEAIQFNIIHKLRNTRNLGRRYCRRATLLSTSTDIADLMLESGRTTLAEAVATVDMGELTVVGGNGGGELDRADVANMMTSADGLMGCLLATTTRQITWGEIDGRMMMEKKMLRAIAVVIDG